MRSLCLAFILAMLVSSQIAKGEVLEGQVSTEVTPEKVDTVAPPPEELFPRQDATIVINTGDLLKMARAMSAQLKAQRRMLNGEAQQQLSCIGLAYEFGTNRVTRVLPGSDLYGTVFPGDRLIAQDGIDPFESWQEGKNFGPAGSITNITFEGRHGVKTIACHRKPVSELMPASESSLLNWSALQNP